MDELIEFFTIFFDYLRNEIIDFFNNCERYIQEQFLGKKIELAQVTTYESEAKRKETIDKMIKVIRYTLSAIGYTRDELAADDKIFEEILTKEGPRYPDYKSYYLKDLRYYLRLKLLEILIAYLVDSDNGKIDNLDIYNLVSQNFVLRLNLFREEYVNTRELRFYIKEMAKIEDYVNPISLEIIYYQKLEAERLGKTIEIDSDFEFEDDLQENLPIKEVPPQYIPVKDIPQRNLPVKRIPPPSISAKKINLEKISLSKLKKPQIKRK